MSVYLGYDDITKQYLRSLTGGGTSASLGNDLNINGFTMSGDINMSGHEVIGLDDPSSDSSATSKKYVDDEVAKVNTGSGGGLDQAAADNRYLQKTDASSTYETQTDATNTYLSKASASVTYLRNSVFTNTMRTYMSSPDIVTNFLRKTDAANTYAPVGAAYAKAESDTRYARKGSGGGGGLSASGFTMTGDIDMDGHNVTGLSDPTNDDMVASKGYVDGNFLDLAGGTMVGDVDMGGYEIKNMLRTPTTDLSAVTKKWVTDEFPTKQEVLGGFTLTGALSLSGNEIYGLPDTPTTDNSAASKKYVDSKTTGGSGGLSDSGFTMKGDINMSGYEVIGVTSVPSFNNSLVNKKYVDDEVLAVSGGINQTQADARYVRKTKTTIGGEWLDVFSDMSFADHNWSRYVKKDTLNSESNIETRVASFVTDMSLSQLLKHKLVLGVRYVSSSSAVVKQLETITLSGKSYKKLSYGPSGNYKYMYSFHIHDEYYIGNDADAKNSFLWQLGAKFETSSVHYLLDTTAYISFALNEAGQGG